MMIKCRWNHSSLIVKDQENNENNNNNKSTSLEFHLSLLQYPCMM